MNSSYTAARQMVINWAQKIFEFFGLREEGQDHDEHKERPDEVHDENTLNQNHYDIQMEENSSS